AVRARGRARDGADVLRPLPRAVAVARGARLLRPDGALAGRPRLAVLALGLAPVPRARAARPAPGAARARGRAGRVRARARVVAAPPLAAPPRRADGGGPARVRARADALVLPVPAVVLPVRRVRAAHA